jgi:cyclase
VKTVRFADPKYVGDPINAVKIFNEKESDELIVLDIDASAKGVEPNYKQIAHLAAECRMPLCYGGGIKTAAQAQRIINFGVEKVAIGSAAIETPSLITQIGQEVGNQSVVVVVDARRQPRGGYRAWTHNGKKDTGLSAIDVATRAEALGAGEIVINSIDHDGVMKGYDLELAREIRKAVGIPMTVLGGAGSLADIGSLIKTCGVIGAAAGSLFVFKGSYRAVLINYPSNDQKETLIRGSLPS